MMKKKMAAGGGIREGKARFGDDVRERARKAIEGNLKMAERTEREPPVKPKPKPKPSAVARKVEPPKDTKATPLPKLENKEEKAEKKASQFGPAMTFPKDVGAGKAATARQESFAKQGPFGDLMDLIRGKKKDETVKKAAGGSVSKRADGCAIRGKTKGRIV